MIRAVWWLITYPRWWLADLVCWAAGHKRPVSGGLRCRRCGNVWRP